MSKKVVSINPHRELTNLFGARIMVCAIGHQELLAELLPFIQSNGVQSFFFDLPTYKDETDKVVDELQQQDIVPLTNDYEDEELEQPSVAYYRIKGTIMGESRWWFSSKQFEKDLRAADENPMIVAHFIHTNSGGGDAWYNDKVAETMKSLQKPVISFTERVMASAALFQNAYANKRFVSTEFDTIGSIGTMISYLDIIPYFEKMGAKWVEEYASESTEKNKRVRLLDKGKPERMIEEVLDPLRNNFAATMRDAIPALAKLPEEDKIMQGTTVFSEEAIQYGLIDGISTMEETLQLAYDMGMKRYNDQKQTRFFRQEAINTL